MRRQEANPGRFRVRAACRAELRLRQLHGPAALTPTVVTRFARPKIGFVVAKQCYVVSRPPNSQRSTPVLRAPRAVTALLRRVWVGG